MNVLENMHIRTNTALARLADLERRAEKVQPREASLVRSALKDLSAALEELKVANEQMEEQVTLLSTGRHREAQLLAAHGEFIDLLPISCLWTDTAGVIVEANRAAALLLNVSAGRLAGKPLGLFLSDRGTFMHAVVQLREGHETSVTMTRQVRPRERKPRLVQIEGRRLQHDDRLCWLLREASADSLTATMAPESSVDEEPNADPSHDQLAPADEAR